MERQNPALAREAFRSLPNGVAVTALVLVVCAMAVRASLPVASTPDSDLFMTLAGNLAENRCYSASPVVTGLCAPTWAQQPPGYPLVIAAVRALAGGGERSIVLVQTLLFMAAASWLGWVLFLWHGRPVILLLTLTVAAFSPFSVGWTRAILTESLGAAAVLWVLAELVLGLWRGRFQGWRLGMAAAAGMLLRWDLVLLPLPILVVLFLRLEWRRALRTGALVCALGALPYLLLAGRAMAVGLPPLPSAVGGEATHPPGVLRFYRVAALDQDATGGLLWPVLGRAYENATHAPDAYSQRADPQQLAALFNELRATPRGTPLDTRLDGRFAALADELARDRMHTAVKVPFLRALRLWRNGIEGGVAFSALAERGFLHGLLMVYVLLVGLALLIPLLLRVPVLTLTILALLILAVIRTAFLVSIPVSALEGRYLAPLFPGVEVLAACAGWVGWRAWRGGGLAGTTMRNTGL